MSGIIMWLMYYAMPAVATSLALLHAQSCTIGYVDASSHASDSSADSSRVVV